MRELLADLLNRLEQRCKDLDDKPDYIPSVLNAESGRNIFSAELLKHLYQRTIVHLRSSNPEVHSYINNLGTDSYYRVNKALYFTDHNKTIRCSSGNDEKAISFSKFYPRSFVIIRDNQTLELKLCVMALSKNSDGSKASDESVLISIGRNKVCKPIYRIDRVVPGKINSVARLSVKLGSDLPTAKSNYIYLKREIDLMRRFKDCTFISQPVIGGMFKQFTANLDLNWKAYILDESGVCLSRLNKALHDQLYRRVPMNIQLFAVKYTTREIDTIRDQMVINVIPSVYHSIMGNLLYAVKAMHDAEVIHGDIKLNNVVVYRDLNSQIVAKLTDFGSAIELSRRRKEQRLLLAVLGYNTLEIKNNELLESEDVRNILTFVLQRPPFVCCIFDSEDEKIEHFNKVGREFMQNISSKYDQVFFDRLNQEPPSESDIKYRLKIFIKHLDISYSNKVFEVDVNKVGTTLYYASPEVFASHEHGVTRDQFFDDEYHPYGRDLLFSVKNNQSTITEQDLPLRPDYKNDIFALGITFYELIYNKYPQLSNPVDCERIKSNPLLSGMLALDPRERFDIQKAIQVWGVCVNQPIKYNITPSATSRTMISNESTKRVKLFSNLN